MTDDRLVPCISCGEDTGMFVENRAGGRVHLCCACGAEALGGILADFANRPFENRPGRGAATYGVFVGQLDQFLVGFWKEAMGCVDLALTEHVSAEEGESGGA
jgi:hypothetical protein